MEGGYAWWWEVVVQGRVNDQACIVEAEATSDERFFFTCTCTYRYLRMSRLRVCVTQHALPSPALINPSISDLIGRKNDIYLHQAETNKTLPRIPPLQPSFMQPTPIRSPSHTPIQPDHSLHTLLPNPPASPQRVRPCRKLDHSHRPAPEAVCLTLQPNGHSPSPTKLASTADQ